MIIDIATHVFPRPLLERVKRIAPTFGSRGSSRIENTPQLYEFDDRFRQMDEVGDYVQIVSLTGPPIEEISTPAQRAEIARIANDSMAELVSRNPGRFSRFVAAVALHDIDSAMKELDRAIRQLGACGVQIYTDVAGRPLDDPELDPFFAAMKSFGLPIWIHPTRTPKMADFASEAVSKFDLWLVLGYPYATAATMIRLVLAGIFERHVGLKIITHHMGGMIPFHEERVAAAFARMSRHQDAHEQAGAGVYMRRPPMEMLRMFYADTAMHGALEATRCGLAFFGVRNTVFGSDCPFGSIRKGLDMIDRLELAEVNCRRILHDNANQLLRGQISSAGN